MINQTIRVLLFSDDEKTLNEVEATLSGSSLYYALVPVSSLSDLEEAVQRYEPDVIVSEIRLNGSDWKTILPRIRKQSPELSIVFLINPEEEDLVIEIIAAGANDFVLKNSLLRLVPVIQRSYFEVNEKRYLKQVTRQKGYFDFIVNNSKSMVSVINKDYKYETINNAFCNAHKLVKDQVVGRSLGEIWGEENFNSNIRIHLVKSFSDQVVRYQAWFDVPEFGNRCYEVTFYPYREKGKEVTHSVVSTSDITEQKLAEIALNESEENYKSLVMNLPVGVFRMNAEGFFIQVNPALVRILEVEKQSDLLVQNLRSYYAEDKEFKTHLSRLSGEGIISGEELVLKTAKDRTIRVRFSGLVKMNSRNEVEQIDCTVEDRTKQAELEAQLRQAQKMETIGTLAGGIAHDFNNILATITGYTEMSIEDVEESSAIYDNLLQVQKASQRAKSLVKQILTFSRQVEQEKMPVRVDLIVNETLEFLRISKHKDIQIKANIKAKNQTVKADPTQIHQLVMNVCTNALQAMESNGGGSLTVGLQIPDEKQLRQKHLQLPKGQYLLFSVKDTGPGMDSVLKERIFEPFFTTKEVGEGTGLGLSVVHGIVQEIGGFIFVDTKPGKGTRFDIFLPLVAEENEQEGKVRHAGGGSEHLIVIDDEAPVAQMYKMALQRMGYKVTLFTDSLEALEFLNKDDTAADLVVVDQLMPELSGRELAEKLYLKHPEMPVILLSGFRHENGKTDSKLTHIKGYLMKPVSLNELNNAIRKVLS